MKRATIGVLAAALVGATGCGSHCENMQLAWTFTDASGNPISCEQSGAAWILIFLDDQQLVDGYGNPLQLTCADGPVVPIVGVGPNPVKLQLDAYDANKNLLYQYIASNVTARQCGNNVLQVDLTAVQAAMTIAYSINNTGNACPQGSYVWYSLFDVTDNQLFSAVDGTHSPNSVPCGSELTFDGALYGTYRLDFIQIVAPTQDPTQPWVSLFADCTAHAFTHAAPNDGYTVPQLQAGGCH